MKKEIIAIGVNYKSSNETLGWLESLMVCSDNDNVLAMIVDTSAEYTDATLKDMIAERFPEAIYLNPDNNLGYFGGIRYGKKYLDDNGIEFSALIISNVDLVFETEELGAAIKKYDRISTGVLAPSIISNGKDINPYKIHRMTKAQLRRRILYLQCPYLQKPVDIIRKYLKRQRIKAEYEDGQKIYMGYGACYVIFKRFFDLGGDLNLPLFLYGEEPFVSETCRRLNLDVIYASTIKIRDIGHVSTSQIPSKKHKKMLLDSARYCIREFYK